jgi:cysteine desulfurase
MRRVYLDHNATTPLDARVFEAMKPYLTEAFGNASSLHHYGRLAKQALERSRVIAAEAIAAKPEEIIFTSGGTESDNLAIRGTAHHRGKGHIIASSVEHHAVLKTCQALERAGFRTTYLPVDRQGRVDPDEVKRSIRKDTFLISLMFANNETGVMQPVAEIGSIARDMPFYFIAMLFRGSEKAQ